MNMQKTEKQKFQYFKRIVGIATGIVVFGVIVYILNFMYVSPDDGAESRVILRDFYEQQGEIDYLYLGSSHVYMDIDPFYLNDMDGGCHFNLATPSQFKNGTFYLLKEADRYNDLSHVYIELYYYSNVKTEYLDSPTERIDLQYYRNWQNTDNMRFSLNKLAYMFSIAGSEKYVDIFFPFSRYRTRLNDWEYVKQNMERKQKIDWQDQYSREYREYRGNGYIYSDHEFADSSRRVLQRTVLKESPLEEDSEKYLRCILDYCEKKSIPVTLFVSPMMDLQLISVEQYDYYVDQIKAIAEEYGVAFYDFNLVKEEYLPIQQGKYFFDVQHLNHLGAELFTPFFGKVVSREIAENEKYFYYSYAEKLRETAPAVYGIYYRNSADVSDGADSKWVMQIASNRDSDMEYRVVLVPENGASYVVQNFSENKTFTISKEEHGVCKIESRKKEAPEEVSLIKIEY